jgi:hypothetical protein
LLLGHVRKPCCLLLRHTHLLPSSSWLRRFWTLLVYCAVRNRAKDSSDGLLFRRPSHQ